MTTRRTLHVGSLSQTTGGECGQIPDSLLGKRHVSVANPKIIRHKRLHRCTVGNQVLEFFDRQRAHIAIMAHNLVGAERGHQLVKRRGCMYR